MASDKIRYEIEQKDFTMNVKATVADLRPITGSSFIPPTDKELTNVGIRLDEPKLASYIKFIKEYGYSSFRGNSNYEAINPLPEYLSESRFGLFEIFFGGYSEEHEIYTLAWNKESSEDRVPTDLLPIGNDWGASLICIGVSGERLGKIYAWTYEEEPLDEETYLEDFGHEMPLAAKYANVYLLAESFDDFLDSIVIVPDEEE